MPDFQESSGSQSVESDSRAGGVIKVTIDAGGRLTRRCQSVGALHCPENEKISAFVGLQGFRRSRDRYVQGIPAIPRSMPVADRLLAASRSGQHMTKENTNFSESIWLSNKNPAS
jgi:hypothetical protein